LIFIYLVSLGIDDANLSVYRDYFEKPFMEASKDYYKTESEKFVIENNDVTVYMEKV